MKTLLIKLYGLFMILAPIANWVILLTKPGFVWNGEKILAMLCLTIAGWCAGAYVIYVSNLREENNTNH